MSKCVECGNTKLHWDYKNGFIVCPNCGVVNERIVVSEKSATESSREQESTNHPRGFQKSDYYRWIRKMQRSYLEFKRLSRKRGIGSRKLVVDASAFGEYIAGRGKPVKLLLAESSLKARKLLVKDCKIKLIVENVIKKHPKLNSRTERAKAAIAFIILYLRESGRLDSRAIKEISEKTGASRSHIRRLYSIVLSVMEENARREAQELVAKAHA